MIQEWQPNNPLPNAEKAIIDARKFEQYSMNPNNPNNQGKWIAFATIGYEVRNANGRYSAAQDIINQLRFQLSNIPAILDESSIYGIRFEVQVVIIGANGRRGILVTKWQIDNNTDIPKLTTNWLKVAQSEAK
ncbi:hypothetical protein C7H19_19725 [Aphanothece hegewaldii CCALA 016]|uniref:DUF6883 domain-containing protein n=1 Tax=Aphanothece hegewaldii CCALA 016 TaxID=2107694 RepID=A0A2T1LT72_9CHRO|nr:DUF6883 domain-containing protein [Aphanothece hegewaldii]PSF33618.1 hypothetical protein C7H19_19725 [Aphanothece hegewaldii CCALA 016]